MIKKSLVNLYQLIGTHYAEFIRIQHPISPYLIISFNLLDKKKKKKLGKKLVLKQKIWKLLATFTVCVIDRIGKGSENGRHSGRRRRTQFLTGS